MATKSTNHKVSNYNSKQTKVQNKKNIQSKERKSFWEVLIPTSWKEMLSGDTLRFIIGLLFLVISLFMFLAFSSHFITGWEDQTGLEHGNLQVPHNYGGVLGAYTAYFFMDQCFGVCSYFIPIFLLVFSVKLMKAYKVRLWKWFINCSLLMVWGSITLHLIQCTIFNNEHINKETFYLGGLHGKDALSAINNSIGVSGAYISLIALAICYLVYLSRETIIVFRKLLKPQDYIKNPFSGFVKNISEKSKNQEYSNEFRNNITNDEVLSELVSPEYQEDSPVNITLSPETGNQEETQLILDTNVESTVLDSLNGNDEIEKNDESTGNEQLMTIEQPKDETPADGKTVEEITSMEPYDPRKDLEHYCFPSLNLLAKYDDNAPAVDMNEQNANRDRIISVLRSFGVEIASIRATLGPTITLYEITPAEGVRISKIRNLEDDIALSLSALGIRIIAPIPGRGTIGIEVPNKNPRIVSMESILNSKKFQETSYELPVALGKTISNEVYMVDLAKMPHLLVAGATGMGKSVGLNAIITSLLYKKHPAELKFVMIDPKKVEFSMYSPLLYHFLAQIPGESDAIITDVMKVEQTLKSLCQLMDHRYDLLKMARAKNIKEYNAKFKARQLNPEKGHEFMPYIVVIIDEFGDLIMTAGKAIELPIARIAQLARAVGIHMVIATQRPTTNIITGTIKANFPARMAFRVSASVDSKTILDRPGAQQLIGRGDMLFLAGSEPVRVQCAFVDTPEVEDINAFISKQQCYTTPFELPEVQMDNDGENDTNEIDMNHLDPLFEEAARLIVIHQQGSTSLIQRKFAIGYNRAGRLMDQLEKVGIVGPTRGAKPREVLCSDESALELKLNNL